MLIICGLINLHPPGSMSTVRQVEKNLDFIKNLYLPGGILMINKELKEKLNSSKFIAYCPKSSKCLITNCPRRFKVLTSTSLVICPKGHVLPISQGGAK